MKSSLGKLRRLALHKSVGKEKMDFQPLVKLDELAQAAKNMQEMRNCYDSLLSAAAATANSAYEFSESLGEMGTCLLEKTSVNNDEESGKMLGMLGRVQLELQKLIDSYRSHIIVTITNPSESLLSELRTVEDMKRQCDEKRDVYEYMIAQQKEKGRSKSGKGENITSQQLKAAHDDYREEATLCAFRLKSLKQGQPRSLLTQAARHYAAQLNFFRKGLKSLEAVEPHIRLVTEQQHIDYQFSGLEEDDDGEDDSDANEGDELSFDYKQGTDVFSTTQNSKEMSLDKNQVDIRVSNRESRVGSHSAPIIAEKKFDPAEKVKQLRTSSWAKSNPHVLPRPVDIKETNTAKTSSSAPSISATGRSHNLWHSSPLDEKKEKDFGDGKLSERTIPITQSVLKESNSDNTSNQIQRPALSASSLGLTELPPLVSRVLSRLPMPHPSSPKTSPSASPPLVSSPRISELHELPLPPNNQSTRPMKSYQIGHSAPLVLRNQERSATNKSAASPLPTPPLIVSRSFSIPSSSQRAMTLHVTKLLDAPQVPQRAEEVASPLSFSDIKRVPSISGLATHSSEIQVDAGGS